MGMNAEDHYQEQAASCRVCSSLLMSTRAIAHRLKLKKLTCETKSMPASRTAVLGLLDTALASGWEPEPNSTVLVVLVWLRSF